VVSPVIILPESVPQQDSSITQTQHPAPAIKKTQETIRAPHRAGGRRCAEGGAV
jgi:hypothetical protein